MLSRPWSPRLPARAMALHTSTSALASASPLSALSPANSATHTPPTSTSSAIQNPLPASFLRGGTSKGVFLRAADLPHDRAAWAPIFARIMGSPDPVHARQLNGMGGGVSSLSKVMVVGPPSAAALSVVGGEVGEGEGVDCEYTFAQVGVKDGKVDYSGNCGNLSSMVGVFALDAGICALPPSCPSSTPTHAPPTQATIRCFNTNTRKLITTTFPLSPTTGSPALDLSQTTTPGVPGLASLIALDFVSPAGARTGKLLPSGRSVDLLRVPAALVAAASAASSRLSGDIEVKASLVDATNPTVFVPLAALAAVLPMDAYLAGDERALATVGPVLEHLRREGARRMGLDPDAQAQPKIALVSAPPPSSRAANAGAWGRTEDAAANDEGAAKKDSKEEEDADDEARADISVHALSMGVLHRAVPMTVGLCLGVAARVEGSVVWEIVNASARTARASPSSALSPSSTAPQSSTAPPSSADAQAPAEGYAPSPTAPSSTAQEEDPNADVHWTRIRHPSGVVAVGASFAHDGSVRSARVVRTGRRLMVGAVWH